MEKLIQDYTAVCPGTVIDYTTSGSGAGVKAFFGGTVDLAGSDSPLSHREHDGVIETEKAEKRCRENTALNLPMVLGPIAVAGRIPLDAVAAPRTDGTVPVEGGPGPAPDGEALAARLGALIRLIDLRGAPALVRAALVHAEMATARPFLAGNAAVGRLLVRHLVTRDGLEPTGVAVTDRYAGRVPAAYAEAIAAYASGTHEGVVAWVVWQAEAILVGIQEAQAICRSVQAGTTAVE